MRLQNKKQKTKCDKESERKGSLRGRNFMGLLVQADWNFGLRSIPHSLSRRALIKSQRRQISLTRFGHFRYLGPRPHTGCDQLTRSCIYTCVLHTYIEGKKRPTRNFQVSRVAYSFSSSSSTSSSTLSPSCSFF